MQWIMMNVMYWNNLVVHHCDTGLVGLSPTLGLPYVDRSIIIARCTMLLTGAPLELFQVKMYCKYDHSIYLVKRQKSIAIAIFRT